MQVMQPMAMAKQIVKPTTSETMRYLFRLNAAVVDLAHGSDLGGGAGEADRRRQQPRVLGELRLHQEHGITRSFVAPPIVVALAKHPMVDSYDLSALRQVFSGAAPLSEWMVRGFADKHGVQIVNYFGSNEGAALSGGLPVIAVDTNPGKEAFARQFGATHFICPDGPDFDRLSIRKAEVSADRVLPRRERFSPRALGSGKSLRGHANDEVRIRTERRPRRPLRRRRRPPRR